MYWTDEGTAKIQRAQLDGSEVEELVATGLEGPFGIALDVAGGHMYWTDFETDKIQRAQLDGSEVEDLVTTGLEGPAGIALDLLAPTCMSATTTLADLQAEVAALSTSASTMNNLSKKLDSVQTQLDKGKLTNARSDLGNFLKQVIKFSNQASTNANHIPPDEANALGCSGMNVLIGIPLP